MKACCADTPGAALAGHGKQRPVSGYTLEVSLADSANSMPAPTTSGGTAWDTSTCPGCAQLATRSGP
jgi:hypothetical protein